MGEPYPRVARVWFREHDVTIEVEFERHEWGKIIVDDGRVTVLGPPYSEVGDATVDELLDEARAMVDGRLDGTLEDADA